MDLVHEREEKRRGDDTLKNLLSAVRGKSVSSFGFAVLDPKGGIERHKDLFSDPFLLSKTQEYSCSTKVKDLEIQVQKLMRVMESKQ